ncbi:MAG: rhomboid family intramembrane serine protease [Vitreoscilla sp.]
MNSVPTPPPLPRHRLPIATGVLIAINVGVWLLQIAAGVSPTNASSRALIAWGGNVPLYTLTGDTWRLLTAMFLHGSIVHLALNMYVLAFTAPLVEYEFGTRRMLAIYCAGGLLASCASVFWAEMRATPANMVPMVTVSVGASGAVMALFGSLLAGLVLPTPRFAHLPKHRQPGINKGLIQAVVINIGMGFLMKGVDNSAHVGGLLGGVVLGLLMAVAPAATGARDALARYSAAAGLVALCVGGVLHSASPSLLVWRVGFDAELRSGR